MLGAVGGLAGAGTLGAAADSLGAEEGSDEPPVSEPHHRLTRLPLELSPSPAFAVVVH